MNHNTSTAPNNIGSCPGGTAELELIRRKHRNLASTGCTKEFCQAGRAVHTDEPRVGVNRTLDVVQKEATDFLQDLYEDGFFEDEEAYTTRLQSVLSEISGNTEDVLWDHKTERRLGGNWYQTTGELEFGIKRAWRNARKCIGRNHYQELKLCDLRSVTSSQEMAENLIASAIKAFNDGRIQPTVFVFAPRINGSRGPMILNHQLLDYAGYKMEDGSILGDPSNVALTDAMIEMGWIPPSKGGRWDLLPLVAMAEGDEPAMIEIPAPISNQVPITHPHYPEAFQKLKLNWKVAPVLTRLGFDIGGVHYTAAPFMGWFVDSEIGVRNLADTFRYNELPNVVRALQLAEKRARKDHCSFEELEEYEQFAILSQAQTELNFAVQWSYRQAGIIMLDSLSASKKWCAFDDNFRKKNGYRLPADAYWIALPQGSLLPVWHRGGSPNYQPKPMIARHVQDPVKAWRRERAQKALIVHQTHARPIGAATCSIALKVKVAKSGCPLPVAKPLKLTARPVVARQSKVIKIYFCSTGSTAEKLAKRLSKQVDQFISASPLLTFDGLYQTLNQLRPCDLSPNSIIFIIISSTGKGDIPDNGQNVLDLTLSPDMKGTQFAIFGNGDTRYSGTYNGAASKVQKKLEDLGCSSILSTYFSGDIATQSIPFNALNDWWNALLTAMSSFPSGKTQVMPLSCGTDGLRTDLQAFGKSHMLFLDHATKLGLFRPGTIRLNEAMDSPSRSIYAHMDIENVHHDDMACVQILPSNSERKVSRILGIIGKDGEARFELSSSLRQTYQQFLTEFVDLELPFSRLDWLLAVHELESSKFAMDMLAHMSAYDTLELLHRMKILSNLCSSDEQIRQILMDIPLLHTRTYSIASSHRYQHSMMGDKIDANTNRIRIMIKKISDGRFSDVFLRETTAMKYRIVDSIAGPSIRQRRLHPWIIVATGAGFGPIRCLLESRIVDALEARSIEDQKEPVIGQLSVFLGLHPTDVSLTEKPLNEARSFGLIDMLEVVQSNEKKHRIQDKLQQGWIASHIETKVKKEGAQIFVCASSEAARSIKEAFGKILGLDSEHIMDERYLEEVF